MANRRGKSKVSHFIFLGSQITVDSDYSHEIKRHLPLERKAMTNPDSVLKNIVITLPTKISIKAVVSPVIIYGCERWPIKKAKVKSQVVFNSL